MRYQRNENFLLKEVAGEYVLVARGAVATDFSAVVIFNETGIFLWKLLAEPMTEEELAQKLAEEFDAPLEAVRDDLRAFIAKTSGDGLLVCKE